jgi:DNA-directed RNA polymerase specialized sigma24 family protein
MDETMTNNESESERISRIHTQWTLLHQAHQPTSETAQEARAAVVQRYIRPIYRYLSRVMENSDAAEDVAHEVVLKLMQGQFSGVAQERGRFRDYLKSVLLNSARAWKKRASKEASIQTEERDIPADKETREFDHCVREELMQSAWQDLQEFENRTKLPYASVLRWRTSSEETSTEALRQELFSLTGRELSSSHARKILQRARDQFSYLIIERIRQLLPPDQRSPSAIEEELLALGLHSMCRSALAQHSAP